MVLKITVIIVLLLLGIVGWLAGNAELKGDGDDDLFIN